MPDRVRLPSPRHLTLPEAAAAVGLSTATLRRHIRRGRLDAARVRGKFGEEYRIAPKALAALGLPVRLSRARGGRAGARVAGGPADREALRRLLAELAALRRELGRLRGALGTLSARLARLGPRPPGRPPSR